MYVVVEGQDLVGKSEYIKKLVKLYAKTGKEIITVTEPFMGHPTGQKIRDFLKEKTTNSDELYRLYKENRDYLWHSVIRPALEAGKIVISDRNFVSSMVYQESMGMMGVLGHNNPNHPDVIYLLSISHETYLKRLAKKKNLEVIEIELKDREKFDRKARRYREACSLLQRVSNKTMIIPVGELA
jgi:Thymidylate kinase